MIDKIWKSRVCDPNQIRHLHEQSSLSPLIIRLLLQRGISEISEMQKFLHGTLEDLPDPFSIPGMEAATSRLARSIEQKEKILFFGDYDVDGITGTAQMVLFFRELGFSPDFLLPHRLEDGYGLSPESVRKIIAKKPDLLVTIDNGTNASEQIGALQAGGIEVIVIDHHESPVSRLDISALVNPKTTPNHPESQLASAGLCFLLLIALRRKLRSSEVHPLPNLKKYLDLACLGTVADVMPLTGTNRLLVKYGLQELSRTHRPGLKALKQSSGLKNPVLSADSVAFWLAPRINATGRLAHPHLALELLLSQNDIEAAQLAQKIEGLNRQRQLMEKEMSREAILQAEALGMKNGIVVASPDWHPGIVGIIAARLTDFFHKPALVLNLSKGFARGSGRTIPGISVYEALKNSSTHLEHFGGHQEAVGLGLDEKNLGAFRDDFDKTLSQMSPTFTQPTLWVDSTLSLSDINESLTKELLKLHPFGRGNPEPLFMTEKVGLKDPRLVAERHLKTVLAQEGCTIDAIGFGKGAYLEEARENIFHSVIFSIEENEWQGRRRIQAKIRDLKPENDSNFL